MASECFMPLAYGGGIKTLENARKIFSLGVEKIIINTATCENLNLVKEISNHYGASSTVVSIDITKNVFGKEKICFNSGKIISNESPENWAIKCAKAGAGELILTDVTRDGTFKGLNLDLIKKVSHSVQIPIVACGGANSIQNLREGINFGASAIAAGSLFSYKNNDTNSILINYPSQKLLMDEIYSRA